MFGNDTNRTNCCISKDTNHASVLIIRFLRLRHFIFRTLLFFTSPCANSVVDGLPRINKHTHWVSIIP